LKELNKDVFDDMHSKHLIESSLDMIYRLNENSNFVYVNPASTNLLGYSPEELIDKPFSQFLSPDRKNQIIKFYEKQLKENIRATYYELPFLKKDGSIVWMGQNVLLEKSETGVMMTAVARDITEKKLEQEDDHTRISRLTLLIENLQEGVLVEDENRKVTLVNRAFCELFSVNLIPDDLIDRAYINAQNRIKSVIKDKDVFLKQEEDIFKNKNIIIAQTIELKDGRVYERDYIPFYVETGFAGNLWKYRDITEKNKFKNNLIKSEKKYKTVIESMRLGLLEVDKNDRIMTANNSFCEILEYASAEELVGVSAVDALLDEEQQRVMSEQMAKREKGDTNAYEIKVKKAHGGFAWMLISGAPLYDENNEIIGSMGIHQDITRQKQVAIELEEKKALENLTMWQEKAMEQLEEKVNERTSEVTKQKEIIESKNIEITNSINYALRIQQALLPEKKTIKNTFSGCFIVFKPKDIVSGDFYYFEKKDEKTVYLAAADSTGHGVPGGFLSMLGTEKLNNALLQSETPGEILSILNTSIKYSLSNSSQDKTMMDGYDIALCRIDLETNVLHYAGAHRPIWILKKNSGVIEEIKATRASIGGWTKEMQAFETHQIQLEKGDSFYVFTDGYIDQIGVTDKKITSNRLREVLLTIQDKSMDEQSLYLENYLSDWKGDRRQTDDILVIGIKL
jgi:PAS domain S-box-containing protein